MKKPPEYFKYTQVNVKFACQKVADTPGLRPKTILYLRRLFDLAKLLRVVSALKPQVKSTNPRRVHK